MGSQYNFMLINGKQSTASCIWNRPICNLGYETVKVCFFSAMLSKPLTTSHFIPGIYLRVAFDGKYFKPNELLSN
jgi:hypothetical protein